MRTLLLAIFLLLCAAPAAWSEPPAAAVARKEAGNQQLKLRHYEAARDQYLAALKLAPDYADAHYNLGVLYFFRLEDYRRALYHLVTYGRLMPDAPDLSQVRSLTAQALGKIEEAERTAYAAALDTGTPAALETFRTIYPASPYAADAKHKLALLAEYDKELRRREVATREAYERAVARATPAALDEFLQTYPATPQAAAATRLRDQWTAQRAADEKAFLAAIRQGSAAAFAAFLEERPQSAYAPEAQKRLQLLRAAEAAYQIAAAARSVPALEQFLVTYGDSAEAPAAQALLDTLRAEHGAAQATAAADSAWQDAAAANTVAAYQAFLAQYPDHAHAPDARARLTTLEQQTAAAQLRAEADRVWLTVKEEDRATAYRDFALAYPDHPQAGEATRRAAALEQEAAAAATAAAAAAAADRAWDAADRAGTVAAYQEFLAAHPEHRKASRARQELDRLQAQATADAARAARMEGDRAWKEADRAATVAAYQAFLTAHLEHPKAAQARDAIADLERKAAQAEADATAERAWNAADRTGTIAAYQAFLTTHPEHPKAAQARDAIADLERKAAQAEADATAERAWNAADRTGTIAAYQEFLAAYPEHPKTSRAHQEIERLQIQGTADAARAARMEGDRAWKEADRAATVAAYQAFLTAHPEHPKTAQARDAIANLERKAAQAEADAAWQTADTAHTIAAYQEFLSHYPNHGKASKAQRAIRTLEEQATEAAAASARATADQAWQNAAATDTASAYQSFLAAHPDHAQAGAARDRLAALEKQAAAAAATAATRAAADRAWQAAEKQDTAAGYAEFYRNWSTHPQADEARRRAAAMTAAASQAPVAKPPTPEQPAANAAATAWSAALATDTVPAYQNFLNAHPEAEEAAAAHSRLKELQEKPEQTPDGGRLSRSRRKALNRYRRLLTE